MVSGGEPTSGGDGRLPEVSRRSFLGVLAAGAVVVSVPGTARALVYPVDRSSNPNAIVIRRREDILRLVLDGSAITIDRARGIIKPLGAASSLRVDFGPQSLVEAAVEANENRPTTPTRAQLSGASRLGFALDQDLPLTLPSLLAWAEREQVIDPLGASPDGEDVEGATSYGKGPSPWITVLELPWWLVLSPHRDSSWTEQLLPKTLGGRTEVFHARLATNQAGAGQTEDPAMRTVRAIWLRDPEAVRLLDDPSITIAVGQTGHPWTMIPTPRDRADIVRLSTRVRGDRIGGAAPAIKAKIGLSPLGGYLTAEGAWDAPSVSSLTAWQQRIWQGRDTYAKVVRAGFLYPWGFSAAYVTEAIRVFRAAAPSSGGGITAFWQLRKTVVVTGPDRELGGASGGTEAGKRGALFRSVHCRTLQTPLLASPGNDRPGTEWSGLTTFTPEVTGPSGRSPFMFELVGVDQDGKEMPFRQPLLFAERKVEGATGPAARSSASDPNFSELGAQQLREYYERIPVAKKAADFAGGFISFAENVVDIVSSPDGESLVEEVSTAASQATKQIIFGIAKELGLEEPLALIEGTAEQLAEYLNPNNFPILREAEVLLEDLSSIAGETVASVLAYPREYLEDAFDEIRNRGQAFLEQVKEEATELAMGAAQAGGVMVAKMGIGGLSRSIGPVFGTATELHGLAADGRITPGEALKAIQILGGVSLAKLIPNPYPAVGPDGKPSEKALTMSSDIVDVGLDTERAVVVMSMKWTEDLKTIDILKVDDATLAIRLVTEMPLVSGSARWSVRGEFSDFSVVLLPEDDMRFIEIFVDRIIFDAGSGRTPSVDVSVRTIDFGGLLQLLKTLQGFLPFGEDLALDVDARGIKADLTLDVPDIVLGAFTLTGIGVKTGITLPFDDQPVRFRFGMSGLDDPFSMTAMGLGGGGWLIDDLGLDGIERLDIAGFFEAKAAVDFGVASGGVSVKAGFQFSVGPPEPTAPDVLSLTAFVSVNGNVSVLGIANATLNAYLGLSVVLPGTLPGDVILKGRANCSLHVSVALFSKTVEFSIERSFKGARIPAPPSSLRALPRAEEPQEAVVFRDSMSRDAWSDYCGAFL